MLKRFWKSICAFFVSPINESETEEQWKDRQF
jgi:hypothetical protein